jgi:hypothetical protein
MLLITGRCQAVNTRRVIPKSGSAPFDVTTVSLLTSKARIDHVDLAKGYQGAVPNEGDEVALRVGVRAFPKSGGQSAGFELTAWENVSDQVKVAAAIK